MNWATSWENLFLPYANNKGADQPAHPRSLISTFIVRCLDSIISLVSISEISNLYVASVSAKAGMGITWSKTPKTGFLVTRLNYTFYTRLLLFDLFYHLAAFYTAAKWIYYMNIHVWAASWQNEQNGLCAQRRLRQAWASAQSDQSLRCPHEESLGS